MTGDALATRNYPRTAPYVIEATWAGQRARRARLTGGGLNTARHGGAEEHAHR